jgi:hypothetical protein
MAGDFFKTDQVDCGGCDSKASPMLQLLVIVHNDLHMAFHAATSNEQRC